MSNRLLTLLSGLARHKKEENNARLDEAQNRIDEKRSSGFRPVPPAEMRETAGC
jgi:hypothetical protein